MRKQMNLLVCCLLVSWNDILDASLLRYQRKHGLTLKIYTDSMLQGRSQCLTMLFIISKEQNDE